jgi:hypothetical protein
MDEATINLVRSRAGEHFHIENGVISGLSAVGRTTAYVLNMNAESRIKLRLALRELEGDIWWR